MGKIITLPFAALLRWIYAFTQSYGLSIIIFAIIVKVVLLPFQMKSKRNMIRMGRLSKKQQELQKQYAKNQQKFQEELQKLYQEEGVSPMGGCLWSFLPLFIIFPLYSIIYRPITHFMRLGEEKYTSLGMPYEMKDVKMNRRSFQKHVSELADYFNSRGIHCLVGTKEKE